MLRVTSSRASGRSVSASASTVVRSLAGHERLPRLATYFVGAVVVLALKVCCLGLHHVARHGYPRLLRYLLRGDVRQLVCLV